MIIITSKISVIIIDDNKNIEYNKNFKRIIKELFYRARKINVSIVFITQSYFRALKDARLNSMHYIIMKINNKKELNYDKRCETYCHYTI